MATEALRIPFGERAGISLLVVDDDAFIARLLEFELAAAGYGVRTAASGDRALELARERCPT
jgi:CheY-like chemotaxis protein